jgi:hypothetical protein
MRENGLNARRERGKTGFRHPAHQSRLGYLPAVLDLYDRKVIGWAFSADTETVQKSISFNAACMVVYGMCPRPFRYAVTAMSFGPNRFLSPSAIGAL